MRFYLKKILIGASILSINVAIAGATGPIVAGPSYNFFMGGTVGIGMIQGYYRAFDAINSDTHYARLGNDSLIAGGIYGVEAVRNHDLYFGLAINTLYNSQNKIARTSTDPQAITSVAVPSMQVSAKNTFQYGLNLRAGKKVGAAVPYALVGVEAGKWSMTLQNQLNTRWRRGLAPNSDISYSSTLVGPQIGAGVKVAMSQNWNLGMEYAHTWFGTLSQNLLDGDTHHNWLHKMSIGQDQVLFSINRMFG